MLYVKFDEKDQEAKLIPLSQGTDEQILDQFNALFQEYETGFKNFGYTQRFKDNECYLEGKHWDLVKSDDPDEPKPHTPVLWSTRENILADLVEAYPKANPEPERVADDKKVKIIADLLNSVRYRRGYKAKWAQAMKGVLDQGVDIIEVFWNKTLYGGLGDVDYMRWSIRNCRFDPYVADVNDSEAFITFTFENRRSVIAKYPSKREQISNTNSFGITPADLTGGNGTPAPANNNMVLVARMFWREIKVIPTDVGEVYEYSVHFTKIAGNAVVERAKANDNGTVKSLYRHGEYPFVPYTSEDKDGSLFPLGLIDRFKKTQWFVDVTDQMVLKNLFVSARQKMLVRDTANIDMEGLKNWKQDIVKGADISESAVRWMDNPAFASGPMGYSKQKADSMKEESGENQFSRGEGGRGVTAMGAIMALQDKGAKRHRKLVTRAYNAECKVNMLAVQLMAEFYTEPRVAVIVDDQGNKTEQKVTVADFLADGQKGLIDMHMRMSVEKDTGYETNVKNQQAVELMQAQAISPKIGLTMMQFDDKEKVMELIKQEEASEITQLRQMVAQMQPIVDQVMKGGGQQGPYMPPVKQEASGE
jgi:hypothetical protein